jgi:hypothetical protein
MAPRQTLFRHAGASTWNRRPGPGGAVEYRHYWELTVLLALRDGLRTGDVFVPGSRRYSDPAAYLLQPQAWGSLRLEFCQLVGGQ